MIILLGFKGYDEHDAEYQVTGAEARSLAALVGHPGAVKVIWANVTFFHEGLDYEGNSRDYREGADDRRIDQLDILQGLS